MLRLCLVSVLALEELGKLMALDGLLFARHDDRKCKHFKDASRSHETKPSSIFATYKETAMPSWHGWANRQWNDSSGTRKAGNAQTNHRANQSNAPSHDDAGRCSNMPPAP